MRRLIFLLICLATTPAQCEIFQFPPDVSLTKGVPVDFGAVTVELVDDQLISPGGMSITEMQTAPDFQESYGGKDPSFVGYQIRRSASRFRGFRGSHSQTASVNIVLRFTFDEPTDGILNVGQFSSTVNQQIDTDGVLMTTYVRWASLGPGSAVSLGTWSGPPESNPHNLTFAGATEITWTVHSYLELFAVHPFGIQLDLDTATRFQVAGLKLLDGSPDPDFRSGITSSDDLYGDLFPSTNPNPVKQKVHAVGQLAFPDIPDSVSVVLESRYWGPAGQPSAVRQRVQALNLVTNQWDTLDSQTAQLMDTQYTVNVPDPWQYVNPVTLEFTMGVVWDSPSFSGDSYFWFLSIDEWNVEAN